MVEGVNRIVTRYSDTDLRATSLNQLHAIETCFGIRGRRIQLYGGDAGGGHITGDIGPVDLVQGILELQAIGSARNSGPSNAEAAAIALGSGEHLEAGRSVLGQCTGQEFAQVTETVVIKVAGSVGGIDVAKVKLLPHVGQAVAVAVGIAAGADLPAGEITRGRIGVLDGLAAAEGGGGQAPGLVVFKSDRASGR